MKNLKTIVIKYTPICAAALFLGACATPSLNTAKAKYCSDLNNYATAVSVLASLTSTNQVGDFRTARDAVTKAAADLRQSANQLDSATGKAVAATESDYKAAVASISDNESIGAAAAQIGMLSKEMTLKVLQEKSTTCMYGNAQ